MKVGRAPYPVHHEMEMYNRISDRTPDMSNATMSGDRPAIGNQEIELVPWDGRCPKCDEQRMNNLAWLDDETVECATCGNRYTP